MNDKSTKITTLLQTYATCVVIKTIVIEVLKTLNNNNDNNSNNILLIWCKTGNGVLQYGTCM